MRRLESIKALYANDDLLADASQQENKNMAVDVCSNIRVIKLTDGRIRDDKKDIYVPGISYLLSFKEADKTVKSRKIILYNGFNVYPSIVDKTIKGKGIEKFYEDKHIEEKNKDELKKWMKEKGMEEITNLSEIYKSRKTYRKVDFGGLVLLQDVEPITPLKNSYELDGVFQLYNRIGKINVPVEIEAKESEFSFLSDNYVKISDGNENIGKYKEGILTLADSYFVISSLEDKIKKSNIRFYLLKMELGAIAICAFGGALLGAIGAGIGAGLAELTKLPKNWTLPFFLGGTFAGGAFGALGILLTELSNRFNGYNLSGHSLMKTSFHGIVKDKRFESIEDLI